MNIRWLKQNSGMVLLGVVFVGGLGALIWQLRSAMAEQQTIAADLAAQQDALNANQGKRPFPSQENIQKLKTDIQKVQELNSQLQQQLAHRNILPPPAGSEIDFTEFLSKTIEKLGNHAENGKLAVPLNYNFGFSRYIAALPCRDASVKKDECLAWLGKQVVVIERLTNLLITNGVSQLDYIHRAEVEPGSSDDSLNVPINSANPLYSTMPFELKFASGPDELQGFINSLTQQEWLVAIRNLDLEVTGTGVPVAQLTADTAKARRVSVTLRLDVIEFPQFRVRANKPTSPGR